MNRLVKAWRLLPAAEFLKLLPTSEIWELMEFARHVYENEGAEVYFALLDDIKKEGTHGL